MSRISVPGASRLLAALSSARATQIFIVVDHRPEDHHDWLLMPLECAVVPPDDGIYIVPALNVWSADGMRACFIGVFMPERICESAYFVEDDRVLEVPIHACAGDVVPQVGIDGAGHYELFLARHNPDVGIEVLRRALYVARNKAAVAEDLGYILGDIGRTRDAIEAFTIAIEVGPSSHHIYLERAALYDSVGEPSKSEQDSKEFEERAARSKIGRL
jgi:hypothetical protein